MSSNRSLMRSSWTLLAMTSGKHLAATLAVLGLDASGSHWRMSKDGCVYRIYRRSGKQTRHAVRGRKAS